jgi:hypothetical protein
MQLRSALLSSIALGTLAFGACNSGGDGSELTPKGPDGSASAPSVPSGSAGGTGVDDSVLYPPSICERQGNEVRLTQGASVTTMNLLWDTDHYLLVYADRAQNGGEIMTMRLGADGVPLAAPVPVGSSPNGSRVPSVAKLPAGGYLVAWEESAAPLQPGADELAGPAQAYTAILDANGAPTAAPVLIATSPGREARPTVAVGPEGPVVTWMQGEYGEAATSVAYVGRLDAAGALVPDSAKPLSGDPQQRPLAPGTHSGFAQIAGDANGLAVVYSEAANPTTATIEFGLLDASLGLTGRQSLRVPPGDARVARLTRRGAGFFAAWEDFRTEEEQVFMAIVDPTGAKTPDALVENPGTGSANWPSVASKADGSASAVVYYQYRQRRPQIFLAYINAAGQKVGGDLQVSNTLETANAKYPEVQWSGSNFGVTWFDTRDGAAEIYFAAVACTERLARPLSRSAPSVAPSGPLKPGPPHLG